jgi:hypothetical protein
MVSRFQLGAGQEAYRKQAAPPRRVSQQVAKPVPLKVGRAHLPAFAAALDAPRVGARPNGQPNGQWQEF